MNTCTCKPVATLSPAELAEADQHGAKERNFDRRAQRVAAWFLVLGLALGGYSLLAVSGDVPAMPWSPIGQQQSPTDDAPTINLDDFDIPEGWEPALVPEREPSTSV